MRLTVGRGRSASSQWVAATVVSTPVCPWTVCNGRSGGFGIRSSPKDNAMLESAPPRATATLPSGPAIRVSLPDPGIRSVAPRRPLLDLDPELGRHLTPERLAEARAELDVQVLQRPSGPWPINVTAAPGPLHMGLLLLEGVIASDVALEDVVSTELLGAGDLVRPWPVDDPERM